MLSINYVNKDYQFYPTPYALAEYIKKEIAPKDIKKIFDPSAGKGDLLAPYHNVKKYAVEIDPNLRSILEKKNINVIGDDWLKYEGTEIFDLIVMNPPFAYAEKHFLKAINAFSLTNTYIVCIMNANTLRNPSYALKKALEENEFNIEYRSNEFVDAERSTNVEIGIVYGELSCNNNLFDSLLDQMEMADDNEEFYLENENEVSIRESNDIYTLCKNYREDVANAKKLFALTEQFISRSGFLGLKLVSTEKCNSHENELEGAIKALRKSYWSELMKVDKIANHLTAKESWDLRAFVQENETVDFTIDNVYLIMDKLFENANNAVESSILKLFNSITNKYAYSDKRSSNVWLYDGWKTNQGKKVKDKFIYPVYVRSEDYFYDNRLDYSVKEILRDIEICIGYFSDITEKIFFDYSDSYKKFYTNYDIIESSLLKIKFYKKGTMHITIKDPKALRRFNIYCGTKLNMLPPQYGSKEFKDMNKEEQDVSKAFEKEYSPLKNVITLQIEH